MPKQGQTVAQANRSLRQEELREQLSAGGHVQHVIDIAQKLDGLDEELTSVEANRLKAAADIKLRLIDKYLPSLKAVEMTGEDGKPLIPAAIEITYVSVTESKD
jgi:hypothetical protein